MKLQAIWKSAVVLTGMVLLTAAIQKTVNVPAASSAEKECCDAKDHAACSTEKITEKPATESGASIIWDSMSHNLLLIPF